jgi:glycosyltransferase involved in cell wall biosynthesis
MALAVGLLWPRGRRGEGERLRVLMVTGIFPPDRGGPASYVPKMAAALVERGWGVEVVCLSEEAGEEPSKRGTRKAERGMAGGDGRWKMENGKRRGRIASLPAACGADEDEDEEGDGERDAARRGEYCFRVVRISRGLFWPVRIFWTVWTVWRRARGCDVVFVNGLGAESALAAWLAGRPTVHKIVGDYAWERAVGRRWFRGTIDEYQVARKAWVLWAADLVRTLPLKLAAQVIVPSAYLRRIVSGWKVEEGKVRVIRNAVPVLKGLSRRILLPPWEGRTLITVCRLVPWKGVDALIRVVAKLPETRLAVAGSGSQREELVRLAAELGVSGRVLFLGDVPHAEVAGCIQQGDAFALCSTYEGLPHVVLEAMAAGVPVIATDAGGTSEVVEAEVTGLLVPVGDAAALQAAVERLWADPGLGAGLSKRALARLGTEFSLEGMVSATEGTLREVVAAGAAEARVMVKEVGA